MTERRIEDYALIGDCETAALVALRRLDRLALLAAFRLGRLLRRAPRNSETWTLAARTRRSGGRRSPPLSGRHADPGDRLRDGDDGAVTLIDFMPPRGAASDLVRVVGRARPRRHADGARHPLRLRRGRPVGDPLGGRIAVLRAVAGPDMVVLHTPAPVAGEGPDDGRRVHGQRRARPSLHADLRPLAPTDAGAARSQAALAETEAFWPAWSASCREPAGANGRSPCVMRSLITLEGAHLSRRPAASSPQPTTSLPEQHRRRSQLGLPLLLAARCDA